CAAAFQAAHMQNARKSGSIESVALPGLGANTGKVPVEICADLMWTGYSLFREQQFEYFGDIRAALEEQLGDLGPSTTHHAKTNPAPRTPKHTPPSKPPSNTPSPKSKDVDFDDFG